MIKRWYNQPTIHVILFFLTLGLGAGAGIMVEHPLIGLIIGLLLGIIAALAASKYWEYQVSLPSRQGSEKDTLEKLNIYVEGKMKRYTLLFGVNGGAFAIVQLLTDKSRQLAGQLTLQSLAVGTILFTIIMTVDIWMWGELMRQDRFAGELAFTPVGKAILLLLAGLIISGWTLAALPMN